MLPLEGTACAKRKHVPIANDTRHQWYKSRNFLGKKQTRESKQGGFLAKAATKYDISVPSWC
jgi:hypothetical protein